MAYKTPPADAVDFEGASDYVAPAADSIAFEASMPLDGKLVFREPHDPSHPVLLRLREVVPTPPPVEPPVEPPAPEPPAPQDFDLRFSESVSTSHPVDLKFGFSEGGGEEGDALVDFAITITPPIASFTAESFTRDTVGFAITLAPPVSNISAVYDNAVSRGPQCHVSSDWQVASQARPEVRAQFSDSKKIRAPKNLPHTAAGDRPAATVTAWLQAANVKHAVAKVWSEAERAALDALGLPFRTMHLRKQQSTPKWQEGQGVGRTANLPHQERLRKPRPLSVAPWQTATPMRRAISPSAGVALPHFIGSLLPWNTGKHPDPGRSPDSGTGEPPKHVCYVPPLPGAPVELVFAEAFDGTTSLIFTCPGDEPEVPGDTVVVPVKRVYIVINTTSLRKVAGDIAIPTFGMSFTIDTESWTWGFQASIPATALAHVQPSGGVPAELEINVNGFKLRVVAEQVARERTFGSDAVRVSGRGKAALLDAPYSASMLFANDQSLTAQQLMTEALKINGVSIGWDLDWQITDWSVPAGLWTHQGTHISALNAIANAAGAYIQPHPTAAEFRVLHRYPALPWAWAAATPDFELPSAVMTREAMEWREKARYNRVFVSGISGGVLGQVTREGTAGDIVAPMLTDALITHADAARQRGSVVLADTGRQAYVTLRLPVLAETSVIEPGKLVRYVDGGATRVGIVRSTAVEVGMPEVWQTLGVETHE